MDTHRTSQFFCSLDIVLKVLSSLRTTLFQYSNVQCSYVQQRTESVFSFPRSEGVCELRDKSMFRSFCSRCWIILTVTFSSKLTHLLIPMQYWMDLSSLRALAYLSSFSTRTYLSSGVTPVLKASAAFFTRLTAASGLSVFLPILQLLNSSQTKAITTLFCSFVDLLDFIIM